MSEERLLVPGDLALVIGASGFVGSYVIKELVNKGYKVRATVRSLADKTKHEFISKLFPEVELVEGNLETEGSYDNAVKGAKVVFLCATAGGLKDPQQIVDQQVNTTLNVLKSAEKEEGVKSVIITTNCGTVSSYNRAKDYVFTEEDWNDDTSLTNKPAQYARVVAEKKALEYGEGKHFNVVVINPNGVIGKPLSNRIETSIGILKSIVDGVAVKMGGIMAFSFSVVTIGDVAKAHVLAAEKKNANGRYVIAGRDSITLLEIANLIRATGKFNPDNIPTTEIRGPPVFTRYDASKAERDLGLKLHSLEEVKDEIFKVYDYFLESGVVKV